MHIFYGAYESLVHVNKMAEFSNSLLTVFTIHKKLRFFKKVTTVLPLVKKSKTHRVTF